MKPLFIIGIILILIVGGILVLSNKNDVTQNTKRTEVTEKSQDISRFDTAPDFSLKDFEGNIVSLSDSVGKVRVINSWATWCPFCVKELADFAKLQEEFGDAIVVIAIDRDEPLRKVKDFTDTLGVTDRMTFLLDPKDSFYTSIGGFSMPETLFIDGDGKIRIHKRGPMTFEDMKEKVESILNNS